jgi:putative phosphoesterase
MRLALLSDIHGNLTALDAVLDELAAEGIERVACLGDVAADGPQPCEVVERLLALRCPVVMGNADAEVLGLIPVPDAPEMRMVADAASWCAARLNDDHRVFMSGFERRLEIGLAGRSLLLFHGSPDDFHAKLPPSISDEQLREAFAGFSADMMAGGHTHMQMARSLDGTMFINPGSVGMAYDTAPAEGFRFAAYAEYAVITSAVDSSRVELRRAAFDLEVHLAALRKSGMPNSDFWTSAWARASPL